MDCSIALNILDSVLPSEDPNGHPDFHEAIAHTDGCDACMELWNARKHFDQVVSKTIVDIEVPGNLKEKLLNQLSESVQPAGRKVSQIGSARFRISQVITAMSLCLICGIGFYFWNQNQTTTDAIPLVTIQAEIPDSLNNLNDFDSSFEATLPQKGWQDQAFTYSSQPKGVGSDGSVKHDRAIFGFELNLHNQAPVHGLLVVYSKSAVKNVPDRENFDSSAVKYLNRGESRFASVSWVSGDQVFVCYVYAGEVNNKSSNGVNAIEAIERVVNLPTV